MISSKLKEFASGDEHKIVFVSAKAWILLNHLDPTSILYNMKQSCTWTASMFEMYYEP